MKWNEFCHSRLKIKCCEENFHYYEVVFKAGDDLHGLRTEGCTLFHHLHLDTSKVMLFGEVKEQIINKSSFFASQLAAGPFRDDFWPLIGNAMAFSGQHSFDCTGLTGSRRP